MSILGREELHRFVQFINGDFLSLCLCRRTHYWFHGLDSSIYFQLKFSQCSRYGQMQIYSQKYLLEMNCIESECGSSSSALPLGVTSRGIEVPMIVAIQPEDLHTGLVQTEEKLFRSSFTPWIWQIDILILQSPFSYWNKLYSSLHWEVKLLNQLIIVAFLFILTAYTMKS